MSLRDQPLRRTVASRAISRAESHDLPRDASVGAAIDRFAASDYAASLLGEVVRGKYAELETAQADRCARALGFMIKVPEIQYHHEVTNQYLWSRF